MDEFKGKMQEANKENTGGAASGGTGAVGSPDFKEAAPSGSGDSDKSSESVEVEKKTDTTKTDTTTETKQREPAEDK